MVELILHDPPFCCFHQKLRIVILVGKEGVEGESYILTFGLYLSITYFYDFILEALVQFVAFLIEHPI
jgi:hypothetical protein